MTAKEPYSYVVLRYIHDVLTGEFVNVGLVMVVPGRPLILTKSRKTFGRIKNVFPDLDSESYKRAIEAIDRGMKSVQRSLKSEGLFKGERTAGDYARIALPLDDSSLQWSPVGAGLTADPQKTFDQLYLRFVSRYDRPSERRRSDDDVWRPVEAKLKEHGVNVELEPKRIQGNTDAVEFRHAWKNGRWHVYEPLSFDLSDADNIKDKARRWWWPSGRWRGPRRGRLLGSDRRVLRWHRGQVGSLLGFRLLHLQLKGHRMRLIPNWTKAWKFLSMQAIALAALWETIPLEAKAVLAPDTQSWITLGLLVAAGLGRMIDQGGTK